MSNLSSALQQVLADTAALTLKTQNYHWNVTGPNFSSLHSLFESQYNEMNAALDEIAERIRTLNVRVPAGLKAFGMQTTVLDGDHKAKASVMLNDLVDGHQTVVKALNTALEVAESAGDEASVDVLIGRIQVHDKHLWMLKSTLES